MNELISECVQYFTFFDPCLSALERILFYMPLDAGMHIFVYTFIYILLVCMECGFGSPIMYMQHVCSNSFCTEA